VILSSVEESRHVERVILPSGSFSRYVEWEILSSVEDSRHVERVI
jgi:hypothetical protein